MKIRLIGFFMLMTCLYLEANAEEAAPVSGIARSFLLNKPIHNATVTVLETGLKLLTDAKGNFGPFYYPIGKPLTLEFSKVGYKTTQSETILVPAKGLTGPYENISFQIPSIITFHVFAALVGASIDDNSCHLTSTVTKYHKILDDLPQGEPEAQVTLIPSVQEKPFYFDIFHAGPLKEKTNPFTRTLKETSEDGGIAFFNLPPSNKPYTLVAYKRGIQFTTSQFTCKKGSFINISPPRGPMALH